MPHDRFFLASTFQVGEPATLSGQEAHHLQHVMRKKVGESVELINGRGELANARVIALKKKEVLVEITQIASAVPSFKSAKVILALALPRINRLEMIMEKGTELGMDALWLFPAERSERKSLCLAQQGRLEGIAIAALKQSGRLDLPKILWKPPLHEWSSVEGKLYFGEPPTGSLLPRRMAEICLEDQVIFCVGPEGGFTAAEKQQLLHLKAEPVSLHPYTLRTETAALAALTLLTS